MKAEQRIYRSVDGEIVAENDPRAAFLVVAAGKDVPEEYEAKVAKFLGGTKKAAPADDKQAAPAENKAVRSASNKTAAKKR